MKKLFMTYSALAALLFSGCATPNNQLNISPSDSPLLKSCEAEPNSPFYLMVSSKERIENYSKCFKKEYKTIKTRRKTNSNGQQSTIGKPKNIIGLGLSGGGIKSSAFQLDLLSGLYAGKKLSEVDYISSVSGGSWANGAYFASEESDKVFFDCLDGIAINTTLNNNCNTLKSLLPSDQSMWASGGLVAKILSMHLRLDRNGEKLDGIRKKICLI